MDRTARIRYYRQLMTIHRNDKPLMCTIFPRILGELAMKWYDSLPMDFVNSWVQLTKQFSAQFITSSWDTKDIGALFSMKEKQEENLHEYAHIYCKTMNEIESYNPEIAMAPFKIGLLKQN